MKFGLKQKDIDALNACFERYPTIRQVVIYGSRAKGNYRLSSDIDLTVLEEGMTFKELLKLEQEIDDLLLPYKLDISLKRQIENPDLMAHIERIGQVFFEREPISDVQERIVE